MVESHSEDPLADIGDIPTVGYMDTVGYPDSEMEYMGDDSMEGPSEQSKSLDIQFVSIFVISGIILLVLALSLLTLFFGRRFRVTKAREEYMKPSRMKAIWQNVTVITFRPTMIFNRSSANLAAVFGTKPPTPTDEEDPGAPIYLAGTEANSGSEHGHNDTEYAQVHPQIIVTDTGEPDTRNSSLGDVFFDCSSHTPQVR